jgi:tetratricopeptide (TPR) repeat protein/TolB-like protein/predicted Ser/Thr protein kinase
VTDSIATLGTALASRYRVEREIGEGGMATVFLATDLKHQRPVAIKVLRPELAHSLGPERFLREIEIAAKLQHPNILPVYDSGEADGLLYYVMPFVEGESLRDRIVRGGPLPPAEAVRIAREVADALDYAHRQGIVHRDIKPANILISQGHAVVADFGIARAVTASAAGGMTQVGIAVGSPTYMSPEQALGDANVDGRTDVFALGVMLFEMLEGKPPFEGPTLQAIVSQTLSGQRRSLTSDPLGLQPVIERALAREPSDRFATAGEMSAALEGVATGSRPAFVASRRRGLVAAVGVAVVALAAVLLWPRGYRVEGDPRQSLIIFPFENQTGDASREYLGDAAMNLLGLSASHWRDMRVFDDERTASLLRRRGIRTGSELDFEAASAMAREARVGTLVLGDIRREGDSLAIEAKVHDVRSGERLASHVVRAGFDADPRPLFDRLAALILGTSGAPPGERPSVLAQTTSSLEAYRAYLAGTGALQRFQIDSAYELLLRAVEIDSSFALAYLRLRDVLGWRPGTGAGGDTRSRRQYVLAAERYSSSLPPRLRTLVEYHRAYEDGDLRRAREIASGLIARDSGDVEAWYQLGEAHYHHNAASLPHPDTLGNIGKALRAFERTLALDSTYILAYQHILDALATCSFTNAWVCLADSAVYGAPDELARTVGTATIERLREEGRQAQVATARGWIAATPTSWRPRNALVAVLFTQNRPEEALRELDGLVRAGGAAQAAMWKAQYEFGRGRPGVAAFVLDSGLATAPDTLSLLQAGTQNFNIPVSLLAGGGGRIEAVGRLVDALLRALPVDSLNGPANLRFSKDEIGRATYASALAEVGAPAAADAIRDLGRLMQRRAGRDSSELRRVSQSFGSSFLSGYLVSRDTTFLSVFLSLVDTTASATWRVTDAHFALARGDTARARMRVDRHYRQPAPAEFLGEQGIIRSFAWGDLLARLGEPRLAIEAFARLDSSDQRIQHAGYLVRSWAERGALYQGLGETPRAIEHYEKFIAAWERADTALQPLVDRARDAVASLKGNARPVQPPPPGA